MEGYGQITNPVTGRKVSVQGNLGQNVLKSYLDNAQSGGGKRGRPSKRGSKGRARSSSRGRGRPRKSPKRKSGRKSQSPKRKSGRKSGRRGRPRKQCGGANRERRANLGIDGPLYGMPGGRSVPLNPRAPRGEHNQLLKSHEYLSARHGSAVGTTVSSLNNKTGYHWNALQNDNGPWKSSSKGVTSNVSGDRASALVEYYGAQPTSLVNVNVVKHALNEVPDRVATKDGTRRVTNRRGNDGKLVSWEYHVKAGDLMDHNYPVSLNAHLMARHLQNAVSNKTNEKISFHSLDIGAASAPPSHMVTADDIVEAIQSGDWGDFSDEDDIPNILRSMAGVTAGNQVNKNSNKKTLWNKMLRNGDGSGLLDYHGLKLNFRGMLFDFVMDDSCIRFTIDKNVKDDTKRVPRAACMSSPSGHLSGEITYAIEGKKIVLKSVKLERGNHGCWPPQKVMVV